MGLRVALYIFCAFSGGQIWSSAPATKRVGRLPIDRPAAHPDSGAKPVDGHDRFLDAARAREPQADALPKRP